MNPILYAMKSKEFRTAFKKILKMKSNADSQSGSLAATSSTSGHIVVEDI